MSWVAAGVASAALTERVVTSVRKEHKANQALKLLGAQKYPEFTDDPRMINAYNRAQAMSSAGYSPAETAQFQGQLAREQSGAQRQALDMSGGQLSNSINGVLQANNTDAINKFAANDASLHRENVQYADSLAQRLQSQRNLQTQNLIARRQMLEQAYGLAKSSADTNTQTGIASVGALAGQYAIGNNNQSDQTQQQPSLPDNFSYR